jgi:hypothetical protein
MNEKLKANEKQLIGSWVKVNDKIVGDSICSRIAYLTENYLEKIGYSEYGAWETLYRDPEDGRYWERIYPSGEQHGGGPAALISLSEVEAQSKYRNLFS